MIQADHISPVAAPIDDDLLARVAGDRGLLAEVIELFLEDGPMLIEATRRALADGDCDGVRRGAHGLAGAASNFGATDVTALARALEAQSLAGDVAASKAIFAPLQIALLQLMNRLVGIQSALTCAS